MAIEPTNEPSSVEPPRPADGVGRWVRYSAVGMQFALIILLCIAGGYGLDRWFETGKPWWMLTGALVGCAAAMTHLIRELGRRID